MKSIVFIALCLFVANVSFANDRPTHQNSRRAGRATAGKRRGDVKTNTLGDVKTHGAEDVKTNNASEAAPKEHH